MAVTGAVLTPRVLTVETDLNPGTPLRIMVGTGISGGTATISTGSSLALAGSDYVTTVNAILSGRVTNSDVAVTFADASQGSYAFNGTNQHETLQVAFNTPGPHHSSISLSRLLSNGEASSVGAPVLPLTLSYNVDAVRQRTLSVGSRAITINNVLQGTWVAVPVASAGDSNHATTVTVSGGTIGTVAMQQKVVDSANPTLYGQVTAYHSPPATLSGGTLAVTSTDTAMGAPSSYPSLPVKFSTSNVGNAALGSHGSFATPLTGFIPKGLTLGNFATGVPLSSSTLNAPGTMALAGTVTTANVHGPVGSQLDILDSTAVANPTTVSMAWRARTALEGGQYTGGGTLVNGIKWLTSDVAKVTGLALGATASNGSPMAYAMQMSFDSRINDVLDGSLALHGTALSLAEFNGNSLYLAQLNAGNQWVNAVTLDSAGLFVQNNSASTTHLNEPLLAFLTTELNNTSNPAHGSGPDAILQSLIGSWGVDIQTNHAWAILDHAGTMAVVPEPATIVMLLSGATGLVVYLRRRKRHG
jgi:hypothetical protein